MRRPTKKLGFDMEKGQDILLFSKFSRPLLEYIQPSKPWVSERLGGGGSVSK
jgi:hypothetical protein